MGMTYTNIGSTTLGSNGTITFSSIPSTYTDLVMVMFVRGSRSAGSETLRLRMNGDTGANYSCVYVRGQASSLAKTTATGQSGAFIGEIAANTYTANAFSAVIVHINNYANTNKNKNILATNSWNDYVEVWSSTWASTSAITSIEVAGANTANLLAGTQVSLYGITAA